MQNIVKSVNKLLSELFEIEKQLERLDEEINIPLDTETEKLNNLIHQTTHELATEIGFNRIKILYLARFIDFKNKFKDFSLKSIEEIVDNETLQSNLKLKLFKDKSKEEKKILLKKIETLKKSWNDEFENKSFKEIKGLIKPECIGNLKPSMKT